MRSNPDDPAMSVPPAVWQIRFTVPSVVAAPFCDLLAELCSAVGAFEPEEDSPLRQIEGVCERKPDLADLALRLALLARALGVAEPAAAVERLPALDWIAETVKAFPPLAIGRFFVHGSHHARKKPAGRIGLVIDANTAFGTGEHPTTHGCLLALERLARRGAPVRRALDMGCGTGILAFAVARLWQRARVTAVDIEAESIRVARINARVNGVADRVRAWVGDGYRGRAVAAQAPYDLIAANILARPLMALARDLDRHLRPGGHAILAGLLQRQEAQVLAAHRLQGLHLVERLPIRGWPTLVLRKRG